MQWKKIKQKKLKKKEYLIKWSRKERQRMQQNRIE